MFLGEMHNKKVMRKNKKKILLPSKTFHPTQFMKTTTTELIFPLPATKSLTFSVELTF